MIRRLAVLSALLCLFSVVATGTTWLLLRTTTPGDQGDLAGAARVADAPGAVGTGAGARGGPGADGATRRARARAVLAGWDALRATAWAEGDVRALRALYVSGSHTGREDARMLERWSARGMRVTGMTTQVHSLEVLGSSRHRWRLRVTDRVVGAVAESDDGAQRLRLPTDGWTERILELRRSAGRWLVLEVRSARS